MKYFVMLRHPCENLPTPLIDSNENVMLFDSRKEAEIAADGTSLGEMYGFVVYEWEQPHHHKRLLIFI